METGLKFLQKNKYKFIALFVTAFCVTCLSLCAEEMSVSKAKTCRENLITEAKKYIGCPYVYGATGPDSFDCSGLIYYVAREANRTQLPRTAKALYSYVKAVSDADKEPGDLLFFSTTGSNTVSHVGIYIGNNQFISAVSDGPNTGVILSSLRESYWKPRYLGAGQIYRSGKMTEADKEMERRAEETKKAEEEKLAEGNKPGSTGTATSVTKKDSSTPDYPEHGSSFYSPGKKIPAALVFDITGFCDWSFLRDDGFMINWRGVDVHTNARLSNIPMEPGLGIIYRWNYGLNTFQLPVTLTLTPNDIIRFYFGPVFTFQKPEARYSKKTPYPSIFPGIFGISLTSPCISFGDVKLQFAQDIAYSVNNREDGAALPFAQSVSDGLILYTGIRVSLPFDMF